MSEFLSIGRDFKEVLRPILETMKEGSKPGV